jgi:hypothetical protein
MNEAPTAALLLLTFLAYFALLLFIAVEFAAIALGLGLALGDLLGGLVHLRQRWFGS